MKSYKHYGQTAKNGVSLYIIYHWIEPNPNTGETQTDYDHCLCYIKGSATIPQEEGIIQLAQSEEGLKATNLGDVLARYSWTGGSTNIVQFLRMKGKLEKLPISEVNVIMTDDHVEPLTNVVQYIREQQGLTNNNNDEIQAELDKLNAQPDVIEPIDEPVVQKAEPEPEPDVAKKAEGPSIIELLERVNKRLDDLEAAVKAKSAKKTKKD